MFAGDGPAVIDQVASGEVQVAMLNPAGPLALALRGRGPFTRPIPLRAIMVIPALDQLALAVSERTGLSSLREIRERRFPLRVSLRVGRCVTIRAFPMLQGDSTLFSAAKPVRLSMKRCAPG